MTVPSTEPGEVPAVLSDRGFYLRVLAPLVLTIALMVALSIAGFQILSAVRAFVGGESLWSKARASAVAHLRLYAATGNPIDHERFVASLGVILGDRDARLALDHAPPDHEAARDGFLRGENAPEDIDSLIRLYSHFRSVSFMQEAIAAWSEGDRLVAQLLALGERMRERVEAGDRAGLLPLTQALDRLEAQVVVAEKHFSSTLGGASRTTATLLIFSTALLAVLLALGSVAFVRQSVRAQIAHRQLLIESNNRWDLAADADGVGVFDWDVARDRFRLDARARALFGLDDTTRLDRSGLRALLHVDDQERSRATWDGAIAAGGAFKSRFRVQLGEGRELRHVEISGRMRDADKHAQARMVGVVRDVTLEVSKAELILQKESAEQAARARMTFLSRLSHELRTPLNAILGMAQLLKIDRNELLTAGQTKRVNILLDSGRHLLRLVDDVLDLTKIDAGAIGIHSTPIALQSVLQASLNLIEPERSAFDIHIDNAVPHDAPQVRADRQRLQQVFVNLLSNGCKYNRRGGRLGIACSDEGGEVAVCFSDQGAGLDAEQRGELFQPFKRLLPNDDVPGTGLGLVVVKLLVEKMNGRIEVRSEPGRGSCFEVRLPKA